MAETKSLLKVETKIQYHVDVSALDRLMAKFKF